MRNLILLVICVLSLNSCGTVYVNGLARQYYSTNQKIVNVSSVAHSGDIVIYHINEKVDRPHLKVAVLEAVGNLSTSYANLILNLKTQARVAGVDAISIIRQEVSQRNDIDIEGFSDVISVKEVVAFGIIYEENLLLKNGFPKNETIYGYNSFKKGYEEVAVKTLNVNGEIIKIEGEDNISKIIQPYSLKHLLADTENWEFYEENGKIQMRIYRNEVGLIKKCKFKYDSTGNVSEILIDASLNKPESVQIIEQKVEFEYDKKGRLFKKKIYPNINNQIIFYEERFIYKNNRLEERRLFSTTDKDENPIAKFVYTAYYELEELKEMFPELR